MLPLLLFASSLFQGDFASPAWKKPKGTWTGSAGVLKGLEVAAERHAAVARHPVAYHDAVIEVRFRFDGGRQFSLSLNRKDGHACRVIVRPAEVIVQRDKTNRKSAEPARVLARRALQIESGAWHTLSLRVEGAKMTASIDSEAPLTGEDPGVDVDKVDVGLTVNGDSVSFRDLRVTAAGR
jgi:hypothetical protein